MMDSLTLSNAGSWFLQVACVVAAAGLGAFVLRLDAPGVRYSYWRTVLAISILLPWLQGRVEPTSHPSATTTATVVESTSFAAGGIAASVASIDWFTIALAVALAGAVLRLTWVAVGILRLRRWRDAGHPAVVPALQDLQRIVGRSAEIRFVPELDHPVTFGVVRPIVLLPSALMDQPVEIQRAVLAHELFHVERRDWAWLLTEEAVRAAFWFHPAVWWLVSRVQLAREEVVDELAVLVTGSRRSYVEALLAFADRIPLSPAPAFARRRHLFRRMLLISREAAMSSTRVVASCAVMALIVVAGARYAVAAFPLQGAGGSQAVQLEAGPLEKRSNPITPENPIPRRISHVEPEVPAAAAAEHAYGTVSMQITLNEAGQVAEARPFGIDVRMRGHSMGFTDRSWTRARELLNRAGRDSASSEVIESLVSSASAAVRQWQYDAPFRAPLTFAVVVPVGTPPPPPPPPPLAPPVARTRAVPGTQPPPPPPPPPRAPDFYGDEALRVGGKIRAPDKLIDVRPIYPMIAQQARVQGVVILEARIEPDGTVSSARVLRSIPLLDQAAIDAVRQWQFRPTLLNGVPIPVIMTTTVNFRLE